MKLACPNCGSNVIYDIGTDRVHCEHCNSYTQIKDLNKNIKNDSTIDLKEHICVSCGAKIITYDGSVLSNY